MPATQTTPTAPQATHTPGPWVKREAPYGWDVFSADMSRWIAYASKSSAADGEVGYYPTRAESEANGQLLSAAPDLLAALLLWAAYDDMDEADFGTVKPMLHYAQAIEATRTAIAKATGAQS